ncbi:MAG: isoprenyl transferase [Deltaproteobacteria bacterium]|nr:isoprenyl transferase [Deltaproteobacteria bacterium]
MDRIDLNKLPTHIAIIMDGNGRWAKKNALRRLAGHKKGADSVRNVVRVCRRLGIQYLTLYAFSIENWQRPQDEVTALMSLLEQYLKSETQEMNDKDIRLITIGDIGRFSERTGKIIIDTVEKTARNKGMILTLALSYGGRDEIVESVKKIAREFKSGRMVEADITKENFSHYLYTSHIPDPDLLIRTSGEYRISNFLLWQLAYTELYFTDVLWPDFSEASLLDAIVDYQKRERRFGLISDQLSGY